MKKQHIQLSESEQTQLEQLLKQGNLSARKFKRILAILDSPTLYLAAVSQM